MRRSVLLAISRPPPPRIADGVEKSVDLLVHQRAAGLALLKPFGLDVFFAVDAVNLENIRRIAPLTRAGVADVHTLASQIGDLLDSRVRAGG